MRTASSSLLQPKKLAGRRYKTAFKAALYRVCMCLYVSVCVCVHAVCAPTWILSMSPLTSPRPSSRPTKRFVSNASNWSMCSPGVESKWDGHTAHHAACQARPVLHREQLWGRTGQAGTLPHACCCGGPRTTAPSHSVRHSPAGWATSTSPTCTNEDDWTLGGCHS